MNVKFDFKENYDFNDLITIMSLLRSSDGCVWDREQTHKTIRNNLIEETYEAVEAIDNGDTGLLKEELGDVLLQVVFHAQIEKEAGAFDIDDVADGICKKLIYRHPHVFGEVTVENASQVLDNWNELKKVEKHQYTAKASMDGVARSLPALMRTQKVFKRAAREKLVALNPESSLDMLAEICAEMKASYRSNSVISSELLGKLLLESCKIAVAEKMEGEQVLYEACEAFIRQYDD